MIVENCLKCRKKLKEGIGGMFCDSDCQESYSTKEKDVYGSTCENCGEKTLTGNVFCSEKCYYSYKGIGDYEVKETCSNCNISLYGRSGIILGGKLRKNPDLKFCSLECYDKNLQEDLGEGKMFCFVCKNQLEKNNHDFLEGKYFCLGKCLSLPPDSTGKQCEFCSKDLTEKEFHYLMGRWFCKNEFCFAGKKKPVHPSDSDYIPPPLPEGHDKKCMNCEGFLPENYWIIEDDIHVFCGLSCRNEAWDSLNYRHCENCGEEVLNSMVEEDDEGHEFCGGDCLNYFNDSIKMKPNLDRYAIPAMEQLLLKATDGVPFRVLAIQAFTLANHMTYASKMSQEELDSEFDRILKTQSQKISKMPRKET